MTPEQAEGITEALNEAQTQYVTKQDLEAAISRLETRIAGSESRLETRISDRAFQIVLWILGSIVLQIVGHFWK